MNVVQGVDALDASAGPLFVVVGVFDGLHRGHAYLLRRLVRGARTRGAAATVITFDHHPDEVLVGSAPPLLLDPAERLDRLAAAGVDVTVVQHFDEALRLTPYDAFVGRIRARSSLAGFVMTPDAAFGHDRRGTPTTLAALGAVADFAVEVVPPFTLDGRPVRSTEIRTAIASGDLAAARRLLGRAVAVVGTATLIDGRASRVRFDLPVALPPDGDYRVGVSAAGGRPSRARARTAAGVVDLDRVADGRVRIVFGA